MAYGSNITTALSSGWMVLVGVVSLVVQRVCGVGRRARVAWTLASLSCCRCHWLASFLTRDSGRPPTPVSCHQILGPHSQLGSPFSWKPCPFPLPPTWAKGSKWRHCPSSRRCASPLLDLATTGTLSYGTLGWVCIDIILGIPSSSHRSPL